MIQLSNPVFISGHTRSGTNLLMRLIDGTEGVLVPPGEGKLNILRRFLSLDYPLEGNPASVAQAILEQVELNLDLTQEAGIQELLEEEPMAVEPYDLSLQAVVLGPKALGDLLNLDSHGCVWI